jgi:hypothetical protein
MAPDLKVQAPIDQQSLEESFPVHIGCLVIKMLSCFALVGTRKNVITLIYIRRRWEEEEGPQEVCCEDGLHVKLGLKNEDEKEKKARE